MTTEVNRQWRLKERPQGMVQDSNFEYGEEPIPEIGDGEMLVQNLYLSFDPTYRGQMEDRPNYVPPIQLGEIMRGSSAGKVVKSNNPDFKVGDMVRGAGGWQDYFVPSRHDIVAVEKNTRRRFYTQCTEHIRGYRADSLFWSA